MGRRALLRNHDFMVLWTGEVLSELGSQTATVAYPLLVLALTHSAGKAGVVGLARWVPLALLALPAGALADRFDRKRLMIGSDVVRLLGAGSIVLALALGHPPYGQIVIVAFLDGTMFIVSYVCERGALQQVVPSDQVQDAVAQNEARTWAAAIVGPPLGGLLFAAARALPFAADAVSYVCSTVAISLTRTDFQAARTDAPGPSAPLSAQLAEGFRWIWQWPFLRITSVLFAVGNPVYTGLYLLAILLAKRHGASASDVGAMFSIVGVLGVTGALAANAIRRRVAPRTIVLAEQYLLLGALFLLLLVHAALLIGVLVGVAEGLTPVTNSVVAGSRVAAAPSHLQGRVQASATMSTMAFAWVGPLAVGLLFQQLGPTATILALAGWASLFATIATFSPSLRQGPPQLLSD
jgi:MFS family permease